MKNPNEMSNEELLDTIAALAVKIDAIDLDLVSSCKRLSAILAVLRNNFLCRMDKKPDMDNSVLLQEFMEMAVNANADQLPETHKSATQKRQECLDRIHVVVAD
jgi:hypothetical protein